MITLLAALFFLQAQQPAQQQMQQQQAAAMKKEMQAISQMTQSSRSIMIIDPKDRANDYVKAWEMLKLEKSMAKVSFELSDGTMISNVIDMKLMPGNTLIVFRYSTPQGILFQVVEVEDLAGVTHQ